jgi:hypothetical protein
MQHLPKWEQRLNKRIRRDLGRITQYLKGINSNHLNNCIQSILNNNRIHCLKYNEYNKYNNIIYHAKMVVGVFQI